MTLFKIKFILQGLYATNDGIMDTEYMFRLQMKASNWKVVMKIFQGERKKKVEIFCVSFNAYLN
jgi:hypothetical protein